MPQARLKLGGIPSYTRAKTHDWGRAGFIFVVLRFQVCADIQVEVHVRVNVKV